jgi:hypothetical protein
MSLIFDDTPVRPDQKGAWGLSVPLVAPSGNVTKRMFWATYSKLMSDWYYAIRAAPGFLDISRPTGKRWLTIVRYGLRPLDRANLYQSAKPIEDVLRPPRTDSGVYKSGPKRGQSWQRHRIGHGLILEDDDKHVELKVINGALTKGQKPYTTITISDFESVTPAP